MTLQKRRVISYTFNVERLKFYLLAEDSLDNSLQRGRKQNASTTVEVRVCLVMALTSVTEALDDFNFVMHACLMDEPLYGYWFPAFHRMEVSNLLQQFEEACTFFWRFQKIASPDVLIVDLISIQFYNAEI
ncbi:MAG: hypothetical protein EZS28_017471 [Streblomastix strix]|uniref:Uncharacterized protein n=1 Tax=Streblomastix strix TaxID=222440 RepID=A0A5J4VXE2_9EUKA|nr:MAG: hypothetical protein EZS28_017471 [Streblomastix strix]